MKRLNKSIQGRICGGLEGLTLECCCLRNALLIALTFLCPDNRIRCKRRIPYEKRLPIQ